jgi:hypothetical protein
MEWLNETLPTRVLLAFVGGLAVVVLWQAIETSIWITVTIATSIKCEWPT